MKRHLLALKLSLLLACDDAAPAPSVAPASLGSATPHAAAAPSPAATAAARLPLIHDVAGLVVDAAGTPIVGRPLVVVDARGERVELVTDDGGTFHAIDVAPPYDVGVERAPSGATRVPVAYLGLGRDAPRLALPEMPPDLAPSHSFRVVVDATCPAPPCSVVALTTSRWGAGIASRTLSGAAVAVSVPVEHRFRASWIHDSESMELDVLVTDATGAGFAYAHAAGIAVEPGEKSDVEVVPAPVAAVGSLSVGVDPDDHPEGVAAWITFASGASAVLARASGPALLQPVPLVPGASLGAGAWSGASLAWSGALDPSTPFVRLDPEPGVVIAQPTEGGTLSLRGTGVAWSPTPWGVTLAFTDVATGGADLLVHTTGRGLSPRRLERLGVALPVMGEHVLDVTSYEGVTVDDLASDVPLAARAGSRADQRVRFVVTR